MSSLLLQLPLYYWARQKSNTFLDDPQGKVVMPARSWSVSRSQTWADRQNQPAHGPAWVSAAAAEPSFRRGVATWEDLAGIEDLVGVEQVPDVAHQLDLHAIERHGQVLAAGRADTMLAGDRPAQ